MKTSILHAQECAAVFGGDEFCQNLERDVDTFLAAHRSCETNDDCTELTELTSICHTVHRGRIERLGFGTPSA